MTDIMNIFKQVALNVMKSQKLADIVYGAVISVSPLKIEVDQKLILEDEFLELTRAVRDHTVEMTVNGSKQTYTVHNALKKGNKVTMIRAHGGQKYIIIDKE